MAIAEEAPWYRVRNVESHRDQRWADSEDRKLKLSGGVDDGEDA